MVKVLIFDFYGVIRSDEYNVWLSLHGLKRDGVFKKLSASTDKGTATMDEFFEELSKTSGIPAENIKNEFRTQASLNSQLLALILKLKKKYKIALLSNASSSYLKETLNEAGINKLFDEIVISSEVGMTKPSKEIFSYMLDKLNVKAEEAVFVDDNQSFVEAANKLGITSICYTNYESLLNALEQIGIINN